MRKWVVLGIASVLIAGCGSTAQQTARSSGSNSNELAGAPGANDATPTGDTVPSGATATTTRSSAAAAAAAKRAATASKQGPTAKSIGTTIRLGVVYLKGLEAAYQAVGASSATIDSKAATQAVVDDLNAHGGIANRKIVPDYYAIDANSATPRTDQLTAACEHYVNDHPVDVVTSYTGTNLAGCLGKKGIPLVNGFPGATTSAATFTNTPLYVEPAGMSLERLAARLPGFLVERHWVDARWPASTSCAAVTEPRVGVVTFDTPEHRSAVDKVLTPAFRAAGHPVVDTAYLVAEGNTANQLASVGAGIQNAILRFSSGCIDHVTFLSQVAVDGLFMLSASQQKYTPRYGFSSQEAPVVAIGNVPDYRTQLKGSLGMGWVPFEDVDSADFDAPAAVPARHCLEVLAKAGIVPGDNNAAILALPSCESVYFVAAAFSRLVATPGATFTSVVNSMGSAYAPSGTYGASFFSSRHDGPSAFRDFGFNDGCGCFRYTSATRPL